ncbi:MAG: PilZ domain-containing protein [Thermodesulfobacteria bacterium]|nr:PilZ domain-containing protein [Thermodesulfobacteriota bacterium]
MVVQERRKHARVVLDGSEVLLPGGLRGKLANASISGLAFWQPNGISFEAGDQLEITLRFRGEEIIGKAIVVHVTEGLVGCEWIDFKDEKQRRAYYQWLLEGENLA